MGDIKSAREIAMEKIAALGEPTEVERLEWKYLPEGEKLAARYLKGDAKLQEELAKFVKTGASYVARGVCEVLIKNINLPKDEAALKVNKIAMDGLKAIKTDKSRLEGILNQIRQIFTHYTTQGEQQRKQAYQVLKEDFQAKVEQAIQQQMGSNAANMRIDIEKQPQFQEEWRKVKNKLESQYIQVLTELKQQLTALK
jgi:flagellar biosynthesis component FlhA